MSKLLVSPKLKTKIHLDYCSFACICYIYYSIDQLLQVLNEQGKAAD